jgi:hypothetical protein
MGRATVEAGVWKRLCPPAQREEPMSKVDYYSEAAQGPHEIFELGNYQLQSGVTLPDAPHCLQDARKFECGKK